MNELSNREFVKKLEQKIPSKKVNFDNLDDVKDFFGDEDFSEYEIIFMGTIYQFTPTTTYSIRDYQKRRLPNGNRLFDF